ncbi:MAG: sialidase family protein [Eubacteriales bacterium]|jgi:hypothetical protein
MKPYTVSDSILFVNHHRYRRSGHLGHALVEYAPGRLLAFYSDCAGSRHNGHNGFGWMNYKRSLDGGGTWGEPETLEYSKELFLDGEVSVSCEKAVCTNRGTIVLSCLINEYAPAWEPWRAPTYLRSFDGGFSWTPPRVLSEQPGRVYDMRYRDGVIYALHFANDGRKSFCGNAPEHQYKLLVSADDGETFTERSTLPFDTMGRGYGSLCFRPDGTLLAYIYNSRDEYTMDVCVSHDLGMTWNAPVPSYVGKRIRNPQTAYYGGRYFLHGRSGCVDRTKPMNFVLYTSDDGILWDNGVFIRETPAGAHGGAAYYSNNLIVHTPDGRERLLIQASDAYEAARTDIRHWWVDA